MHPESVTQSDSFAFRALKSEVARTQLMVGVFGLMLVLLLARRVAHGAVFADDRVFWCTLALVAGGVTYEFFTLRNLRRAVRESRLWPAWRWSLNAAVELCVPLGTMLGLRAFSPQGEMSALSAPVILTLPLLIMLSVLRLRPRFTLLLGLVAAVFHLGLTASVLISERPAASVYPVLFTYSAILAVCAFAGSLVARAVAGYVREAAAEAAGREQARQQVEAIEHDLSIARDIQRDLIPQEPPDLPGYDVAGMSRPADQTGGDYYDWQALPDGRTVVVLADVTGHGIGPAMVMAVCRAYARASAPLVDSPAQLLSRLNKLVHDDVRGRRFITLAVAIVEPRTGRVQLLSAGHGPTLLYRAGDASIASFGGDGVPLGIMPESDYGEARVIDMLPGDVLLLSTDGFFEWQSPSGEQFGTARLEQSLRASAGQSAATIIERLDSEVREFAQGRPQADDTTAVALKRLP